MKKHEIKKIKRSIAGFKLATLTINETILKLEKLSVDFSRGSIYQRVITDLDGARVTCRAAAHLLEQEIENASNNRKPSKKD